MLIFGLIGIFGSLALIGWLTFKLATYALPALVAVFAARALHAAGLEWLLAAPCGALAGFLIFAAAQLSLALLTPTWVRLSIILAFIIPAAMTGYYAAFGSTGMISHNPLTQTVFGAIGAIVGGAMAFKKLITPPAALTGGTSPAYVG